MDWIAHDNGECPIDGNISVWITHSDPYADNWLDAYALGPAPAKDWAWLALGEAPRSMFYRFAETNVHKDNPTQ